MNYEDLEIWKLANELAISIHRMTIRDLPDFEKYETGKQIRRSMKSVKSNIVEGFGRRAYKNEFIHFLVIAQASNDESIDHLNTLYSTGSLTKKELFEECHEKMQILGKKLNLFIQAVKKKHKS
jgi:four helix bundle protein